MNDRNRDLDLDNLDDPEALVADHERELLDQQSRLDLLEDRLNAALPIANTPQGGAQRFMLEVPLPRTVFSVGAVGKNTSYSRAIGPGGFGLETAESLGVHVEGGTCIDTDGLTVVHSGGPARLFTQADLGIASAGPIRVGTQEGSIEITAGWVSAPDPEFTVVPSMPIPKGESLAVDTASPRSAISRDRTGWDRVWKTLRGAAKIFGNIEAWGSTVGSSIAPKSVQKAQKVLSHLSTWRSLATTAWSVASEAGSVLGADSPFHGPNKVRIHADDGVDITTPAKASIFGERSVSCSSPLSAELRGGFSAGVYSPVSASCYGVGEAKLKSEGIAEVSGRYVIVKGHYCEVQSQKAAAFTAGGDIAIKSLAHTLLEGKSITANTDELLIGANELAELRSDVVFTGAERTNTVKSSQDVVVEAGKKVDIKVEDAHVEVHPDRVAIKPGGTNVLNVQRGAMSYGNILRVTESRTTIRGECSFG